MTLSKQHRFRLPAVLFRKQAPLCALVVLLLSPLLFTQKPRMTYKSGPVNMLPQTPDDRIVVDQGGSHPGDSDKKVCSIQPFPGIHDTVSVTSLQIPGKAQKEYEEACAALKSDQLPEAEKHLRKATTIYPNYVAGWVMLGQVLESRQQPAEAHKACARASSADPNYLAAYLCLAEIAGRAQQWQEVLKLTNRALELDAANDAYAYFFSAIAYFNLNQLPGAEISALKAETIDRDHDQPLLQLLLAQIYDAKHDRALAAFHLSKYRELTQDSQDSTSPRQTLTDMPHQK